MPGIQVLDDHMVNKIAAGEVVERPSAVVKELVENAIDAGARAVTIEIKEGGTALIRVTDNGAGIPKAEAKQAFLRHATSKISQEDDLDALLTLGFRGEALSSIAAVSQVELVTKTAADQTGTRIEIHGGAVLSETEIGCADGTTFIARNLFYNTPARKKFLRKNAAESGYVSEIVSKLALGRPEIAFKYINNGSTLIQTSGNGDLKAAILQIYGKETAQKLIAVAAENAAGRLSGFIGKPELGRATRSYGNLFINGRFVKSPLVQSAVAEGFQTRLMTGKFPLFVLNLAIGPADVDVNVHPTKLEVRFSDEDGVFALVKTAVERALKEQVLIPDIILAERTTAAFPAVRFAKRPNEPEAPDTGSVLVKKGTETEPKDGVTEASNRASLQEPVKEPAAFNASLQEPVEEPATFGLSLKEPAVPYAITEDDARTDGSAQKSDQLFFHHYKIIGQLFTTYWLVEQEAALYLIDQHAAHEKILYESFTQQYKAEETVSQRLVAPAAVRLNERETRVLAENRDLLTEMGFEIEDFGNHTVALRGVPNLFNNPAEAGFFLAIIDRLAAEDFEERAGNSAPTDRYDMKKAAIAQIACKAAVKANDRLGYSEAKALIESVLKLADPFHCPHGRPTIVKITKHEIEKMFRRLV